MSFWVPMDHPILEVAFLLALIFFPFALLFDSIQKKKREKSHEHHDNVLNDTANQVLKVKIERRRKLSQNHEDKV